MNSANTTLIATQVAGSGAGYYTAIQVSTVATTLNSVFANFADSGYTASLQAWILANPTLFTTNPTTAELTALYNTLHAGGSTLTQAQVDNYILNIPLADRQLMYSTVQTNGLTYLHTQIVTALNSYAATVEQIRRTGGAFQLAKVSVPWLNIGLEYVAIASVAFIFTATGVLPVFATVMAIGGGIALLCSC